MNEKEFYKTIEDEETPQAERLAGFLIKKYNPISIIDVGCATGLYLKPFDMMSRRVGVELSETAIKMASVPILQDDITNPSFSYGKFDIVLCLEVLEHIPQELEDNAIKTIVDCLGTGGRIVFSAARPGQGGEGHINCHGKGHWRKLFFKHNVFEIPYETKDLVDFMLSGYRLGWLPQNVMILGYK